MKAKLSPAEEAEVSLSLPNRLLPCGKPVKITSFRFQNLTQDGVCKQLLPSSTYKFWLDCSLSVNTQVNMPSSNHGVFRNRAETIKNDVGNIATKFLQKSWKPNVSCQVKFIPQQSSWNLLTSSENL